MKTFRYEVLHDDHPESPREWDNLGKMVCWHRRYTKLGDEQPECSSATYLLRLAHELDDDLQRRLDILDRWWDRKIRRAGDHTDGVIWAAASVRQELAGAVHDKHLIMLPLYLYDHGEISISTAPFSCRWDSGQVGFIYAKKGTEGLADDDLAQLLRKEVEIYDQFLTGDVWGYRVFCNETDEEVDTCYGYYGEERCEQEAQSAVEYYTEREFAATEDAK